MGICKVRPLKRFGQNFITDESVIRKITNCAKLKREDTVLEIGAGHGELTGLIAENAGKVIAIEIDRGLCRLLNKKFSEFRNVEIIEGDILKLDIGRLVSGKKMKVIGNLPYYMTTPILMKLFGEKDFISHIIIMVQKEVGERMAANPGGKTYGALSVSVSYHTKIEKVIPVSKHCFHPEPKVDSCLISMSIPSHAPVKISGEELFFGFIKEIFGGRRKMLYNTFSKVTSLEKKQAEKLLLGIGIDPRARPEKISLQEFANIFNSIA